ncbi:hypothetical protein ALQ64_02830 [Pseudomonas cannabina]|uniref:Uncharacterized protein n=1 Tax=Pseudomonas cannabina TaxID=86840 RepID=A0A3M3KF89_PSECA|nr:hypothetical protein [Pseudomonas cannabina]RMN21111.1 hypothetical protein ALQ64_02830 [Pseudomonas cannabina]
MSISSEMEQTLFDKPSGNVRGLVHAFVMIKGKRKRIAHATLLVGEQPSISVEVPRNLTLEQIEAVADRLKAFVAKVSELATAESEQ